MAESSVKRAAHLDEPDANTKRRKTDYINICIIKAKLSSTRLLHLKKLAVKNGFQVSEEYSDDVSHIVSSVTPYDKVLSILNIERESLSDEVEIVSVEWLTDTFVEGRPVQVTDRYRIHKPKCDSKAISQAKPIPPSAPLMGVHLTEYECQRPTLLVHHNPHITDALELLEKYYEYLDYKQGDTRALAFRQASCAIKAFPRRITDVGEVSHLHRIGKHSMRVIEEIIENGCSSEVEDIKQKEWFQCMQVFTLVYGCGSATADKWYNLGLRTIEDVRRACQGGNEVCQDLKLSNNQQLGLLYHESLSQPIPRAEVGRITDILKKEVLSCCPGASVEAVGGYRRGKPESHDVDILLSHKDKDVVQNMLETIIDHLRSQGIVIHADVTVGLNTLANVQGTHELSSQQTYNRQGKQRRNKFDHLDKAYCIIKVDCSSSGRGSDDQSGDIRRVDLIVSPPEQYPFALVSWTGSKQFNRSLRRYSVKECQKTVTAHGIYDIVERKFIKADSEEDVFSILKLEYLEPNQRNC